MKINEVDKQITSSDLEALETFADRIFGKVGIDVEFTRHFLDRVNDERNGKQITASELTRLFKQEHKKWGKPIAKMGPDAEAVMKDLSTDINMPFALVWDKENEELDLIVKTVMRKKDFKTSNKEFTVEVGRGYGSMGGQSGLRHTPTRRSDTKHISLPLPGQGPLKPVYSQNPFRRLLKLGGVDEFTEDKDYRLIAQRETMNLSDQAIIALIASLYKRLDDKELNEELSIGQKQQRRRNRMNAHLQKTMKKYGDAEKAGIHPSRVNQRRTQMTVKKESRLSLYDTLMKMEESDIEEFEKDFSKLNEFTLVDVKDMIKKGWMARPTEKQWKNLVKIYNKYNGNVTRKDLLNVGIASLGRKESVKEKQEKKDPLINAFDPKTARAMMMLKAKYPQADNILSALLADVENNEKDSDVADLSHEFKVDKLTKEVDILQKEINLLKRKQTNETGGVGKIVPGVNTSIDVGPNEIKKQAAKFGNAVDKDGVPKKNLR